MDEYDVYKEQEKGVYGNFVDNIKPWYILVASAIFIIVWRMTENGQNTKLFLITQGVLLILFILLLLKKPITSTIIPRRVAMRIAYKDLKSEVIDDGVFPVGTIINPAIYCFMASWDNADGQGPKPWKWNIGFVIKRPGKTEEQIVYKMNPYTGHCTGIVEEPLGYDGRDTKDVKYIEVYVKKDEAKL